ncbi:TPA: hypothetical protein ACSPZI_002956 [Aeromonas hydrophila]
MQRQTFINTMRGIGFWDEGAQTTNPAPDHDTPPAVVNATAIIRASPPRTPPPPPASAPVMATTSVPVASPEPAPQHIRDRLFALDVSTFCFPTTLEMSGYEKLYFHSPQAPFGFLVPRMAGNAVLAREATSRDAIERAEPALSRFLVASRLVTNSPLGTGYLVEHLAFAVTPNGKPAEVKPKFVYYPALREDRWNLIQRAIEHSHVSPQRVMDDLLVIQAHLPTMCQHVAELCLAITLHDSSTTVKILDVARTEGNQCMDKDSQAKTSQGVAYLIAKLAALPHP